MTSRIFTSRDSEILSALTQKVRLFTLRQITTHWWNGELANARRRLRVLAEVQLVQRATVRARTLPPLERPVAEWLPGRQSPDFGTIAQILQARWHRRPVRSLTAFTATPRAARFLGGSARDAVKVPTQATHDIGLAQVWLLFASVDPPQADAWHGEDLMAHTRRGQKLPDAFLLDAEGTPMAVVEFGGSYDARRVRDFHADCARRNLPYQIW
ncbi:MAG: hypothetical protein ACYTGL_30175 [Planctomycetota bacterium]|jgi:hypothetical protein